MPFLSPTSVCSTIFPSNYQVYVDNSTCLQAIEQDLAGSFPSTWFSLSQNCQIAVSKYQCLLAFPSCEITTQINDTNYGISLSPCQSICDDISGKCNNTDQQILSAYGISLNSCSSASNCQTIPDPTIIPIPQCQSYQGTVCAGIIDYPVYIPPTLTQEDLEAALAPLSRVFAIAPRDNDCQKHAAAFYCSQTFMKCDTGVMGRGMPQASILSTLQVPFPTYACKSLCLDYNATCSGLFALDSILIPDCDAYGLAPDARRSCNGTITTRGQDNFPLSETVYANYSVVLLSSPCDPLPISSFSTSASAFSNCPFPLVQPEDYDHVDTWVLGSCALPCPVFTSTIDENRTQDVMWTVFSWISFIYFPIVGLPYFLFPAKRKHFHVLNLFICGAWGTIQPISGIFKGTPRGDPRFLDLSIKSTTYRCINNAMAANSKESPLCGWILFSGTMGGQAIACWWLIICIDLFYQIVLERKTTWNLKLKIASLIYGWGVPLFFYALVISLSPINATGSWNCGIADSNIQWMQMSLSIWNIAVGSPLLAMTIGKAVMIARRAGRVPTEAKKLVLMLFFFFVDFSYVFIADGILYQDTNPVVNASVAWLGCLLENMNSPNVFAVCGTQPSKIIDPQLLRPFVGFGSTIGLILAGLFTDLNVFRVWIFFFSSPNRCSLSKMTDSNLTMLRQSGGSGNHPNTHSDSSKPPLELVKVETSLLTKAEASLTPDDGDNEHSPSHPRRSQHSKESHRMLFNPFTVDSPASDRRETRGNSYIATPTQGPLKSPPESPRSESIDASISGMESPSINPLFFPLPAVLESSQQGQISESSQQEQGNENLSESQKIPPSTTSDNLLSESGSTTPLVAPRDVSREQSS